MIKKTSLLLCFILALAASAYSLYLSETLKMEPCPLCWYQRICLFPLPFLLFIPLIRRDYQTAKLLTPLPLIGLALSIFSLLSYKFPQAIHCSSAKDCFSSTLNDQVFFTIAMSPVIFSLLLLLLLMNRKGATASS